MRLIALSSQSVFNLALPPLPLYGCAAINHGIWWRNSSGENWKAKQLKCTHDKSAADNFIESYPMFMTNMLVIVAESITWDESRPAV